MGSLTHWEILDPHRIDVLRDIVRNVDIGDYYLAGGTALSLQMGLRDSLDFDFFVPGGFEAGLLAKQLEQIFSGDRVDIYEMSHNTCHAEIAGVSASFLGYSYHMLNPYVTTDGMPGLKMASVLDIAEMKLSAIGGRGAKKDFFDLYHILNDTNITIGDLVDGLPKKYGCMDFSYMAMGLSYFEDADREKLPPLYVPYDWREIKAYFRGIQDETMDALEKKDALKEQDVGVERYFDDDGYDPAD